MRSFIERSAVKKRHQRQPPALISFVVWSYNHEPFLEKAIQGAFAQTYEPLEVILSDDHSQDRSYAIMEKMAAAYRGSHTVVLNRNPRNLGIAAHINRIVALARGSIIFLAGGDDFSLPKRVEDCYKIYSKNSDVYGVWTNAALIDDQEKPMGFIGNK